MLAFAKDESGAITADWVVLAAAVVGLGVVVVTTVSMGTERTTARVEHCLNRIGILTGRDNVSHEGKLGRMARQCARG